MIRILPTLPPEPNRRHFRMHTEKGWLKIKDRIHTSMDLQIWIDKIDPIATYVSVSKWLNPTTLGQQKKFTRSLNRWADNIFLGSDFVLDFDTKDTSNVKKAIQKLKYFKYNIFTLVETGRGYHLWVLDFDNSFKKKQFKNSWEREEYYISQMRKLSTKLAKSGIKHDKKISEDTRRIVKVWDTYDKKREFKIILIDWESLFSKGVSEANIFPESSSSRPMMFSHQMLFHQLGVEKASGLGRARESYSFNKLLPQTATLKEGYYGR